MTCLAPRLPNRTLTDELVLAALELSQPGPTRWAHLSIVNVDDLADLLGWSVPATLRTARYLTHSYDLFGDWGASGTFMAVVQQGLDRYEAGDRTVCPCCAGENER